MPRSEQDITARSMAKRNKEVQISALSQYRRLKFASNFFASDISPSSSLHFSRSCYLFLMYTSRKKVLVRVLHFQTFSEEEKPWNFSPVPQQARVAPGHYNNVEAVIASFSIAFRKGLLCGRQTVYLPIRPHFTNRLLFNLA